MRLSLQLIAPVLAGLALAPQALAAADENEQTVTVRIVHADLDLTKAEDRAELEKRVEANLRRACMRPSRPLYVHNPLVDRQCVEDARAVALAEVERVASAASRETRKVAAN